MTNFVAYNNAAKLACKDMVSGLLQASKHLQRLGRGTSSSALINAALAHSSSMELLNICLQHARDYNDVQLARALSFHAKTLLDSGDQHKQFIQESRQLRSDLNAAQIDMMTPFEELIRARGFEDAERVLYADIDLNTVDGSALWMASMIRIMSRTQKLVVVSKNQIRRDFVVGDLVSDENVLFITPGNTDTKKVTMPLDECVELIRKLDNVLPSLSVFVVRGLNAVDTMLADRQFYKRIYAYLTDIYAHTDTGIVVKEDAKRVVDIVARQGAGFLVQTPEIQRVLEAMLPMPARMIPLPPPVSDSFIDVEHEPKLDDVIRIGYAGKIAPQWGINHLAKWVEALRADGHKVEVTIIGDKVSGAADAALNKHFRHKTALLLKHIEAQQLGALERQDVLREMQKMDFAWCWRPADFENHTLELSSKLVEAVIAGIPAITYPSPVNRRTLGDDYSFFAEHLDDFRALLTQKKVQVPSQLRNALNDKHQISRQANRLDEVFSRRQPADRKMITVAAHDPKFLNAYSSTLKLRGHDVLTDNWNWGDPGDENRSRIFAARSDVVLCEWGLANAVWYSRNLNPKKKLIVRVHAQEVRERAQRLVRNINHDNVDLFVFVAEWVRDRAIELYGWPKEKTVIIPNFLLEKEFTFTSKKQSPQLKLAMVGMVPLLKRFDRALDLVKTLVSQGHDAELHIKGRRPEDYPFMHAPGRAPELQEYKVQYQRMDSDPDLEGRVHFHGWGNDVARFYSDVDYVLSPSDNESFHYALADGVLAGCYPIIWQREGADTIFTPNWVVRDTEEAAGRIISFASMSEEKRNTQLLANRELLVERYGSETLFSRLNEILLRTDCIMSDRSHDILFPDSARHN